MESRLRTRLAAGALGLALLSGAVTAQAQIQSNTNINPALNCAGVPGGCIVTTYGLGAPDSFEGEPNPWNPLANNINSFDGSFFYSRNNPVPGASNCIAERGLVPVQGQVQLREQANCIPPDLGAGVCRNCGAGGCTNGTACTTGFECPNGLCSNLDAGCPVEIASDLGTPGIDTFFASGFVSVSATQFGPIWVSTAFNGALVTDGVNLFSPSKRAGLGRRFTNPGGGTRVFWIDQINGGGNTGVGQNYSTLCCNDVAGGALCSGQLFNQYPALTSLPERANEGRNEAPWIWPSDDPATGAVEGDWALDINYVIPGQIYGNCANNRSIGCSGPGALNVAQCTAAGQPFFCCTGAGTGNCGNECAPVGGDCDLREIGWRFNRALSSLPDGSPDPGKCNASPFVFRGRKNAYCSVLTRYNECLTFPHNEACVSAGDPFACCTGAGTGSCGPAQTCNVPAGERIGRCSVNTNQACSPGPSPFPLTANFNLRWGDPGPDCAVRNFGPQIRPDVDCDGVEDPTIDTSVPRDGVPDVIGDACPYYSEINTLKNTDNTGRADECECGDANRDGLITVSDIVTINTQIFNPPGFGTPAQGNADLSAPLSDTNEDGLFNVSDIVAVNVDIFSPLQTSRCGRAPVIGE